MTPSESDGSVTPPLSASTTQQTITPSESATPPLDSSHSEGSVTPPLSVSTPPQTKTPSQSATPLLNSS